MNKKEYINQILDLVDRSRTPVKRTVDFSVLRTLLNEAIPKQLNIDDVLKSECCNSEIKFDKLTGSDYCDHCKDDC